MSLELPRSLAAFGTDRFIEVLEDEVVQEGEYLPIADVTDGGYPDFDSLEVKVLNCTADKQFIYVRLTVYIDESIPSSCADFVSHESHQGEVSLRINRETAEVQLSVHEFRCTTDHGEEEDSPQDRPGSFDPDDAEF